MSFGGDVSVKKRKVIYDDFTNGFYTESSIEALKRQCEYRAKVTEVRNKSEDAKYNFALKQVQAAKHIFEMKTERESSQHKENIKDHKAHMQVLENIAKEREESRACENDVFGKYGPGTTRGNLDERIGEQLKEMSPVVQRRKEADRMLSKRHKLQIVDRNLPTEELFKKLKSRRSRSVSPARNTRKTTPKLILPPISVKMAKDGNKARITNTVSTPPQRPGKVDAGTEANLPSVFVTQYQ